MDSPIPIEKAPEGALVASSRARDVRAFEELVRRHKRGLVGFAYTLVSDLDTAREVAHDAFCAAYFSLDRLRDPDQFTAWLYTIARNFALADRRERERHRRRFRSLTAEGEDGEPVEAAALESREPAPDVHTDRDEMHRRLAACIARLPDPLRLVVTARYFDNLSCDEIASRSGAPVGTITKRLTRARRLLRDRLGGRLGSEGRSA
jgi:RNA polymerase sigma factor (sigma-70 family)